MLKQTETPLKNYARDKVCSLFLGEVFKRVLNQGHLDNTRPVAQKRIKLWRHDM